MKCPNCSSDMQVLNFDNEIVLHCKTCGSSFFEKNGINLISRSSAQKLAEDAQGHYVLGNQKACPKDGSLLTQKIDDPTIAKNTVLLECPSCFGLFAYPDDLLKYKGVKAPSPISATSMKLLPAPKTIFMLSVFAVLSLAFMLNFTTLSTNLTTNTRADVQIHKERIMVENGLIFVAFTTDSPYRTKMIFIDTGKNKSYPVTISDTAKTTHIKTITIAKDGVNIDIRNKIRYQIFLDDNTTPTVDKVLKTK